MATDLCYQLKINNDKNQKLTLTHKPKHDLFVTCRYGFGKMQKHI